MKGLKEREDRGMETEKEKQEVEEKTKEEKKMQKGKLDQSV